MRSLRLAVLVALALVSVGGRAAYAQDEGSDGSRGSTSCGQVSEFICSTGLHTNDLDGSWSNTHSNCLHCLGQNDTDCHGACSAFLLLDEGAQRAFAAAQVAASSGDATALIRVGPSAGGYVMFNKERNAVQLASCAGTTIVASFSLDGNEEAQRLALSLPDVTTALPQLAESLRALVEAPAPNAQKK